MSQFDTPWYRYKLRGLMHAGARPPGVNPEPQRIRLDVAPGMTPSAKPPVRLFIGTELDQGRAERVLVWSVMQHRDPARVYEIYLMKEIAGFDRRRWKTGFTCYRYAIPHWAGASGRAIYNDVDQIYLGDPAELFDLDMGEHGYLSLSEMETSVMLIDCARMAPVWPYESAHHELKKFFRRRAQAIPGLWGRLPGEWNARDSEFVAGKSKLLHYTTLHTQPWKPFPKVMHYWPNSLASLWEDMEHAADVAGFDIRFS